MKTKLTLALVALITGSAFGSMPAVLPEFKDAKQLAEWRAEMAGNSSVSASGVQCSALDVPSAFYTGKPYVDSSGGYAFKCRSYNPELARWTSEDPSGFPDGANGNFYAPIPTCEFDYEGLMAHDAFANQTHAITLSVYVYDDTESFTNWSMNAWKSAVESAWSFNGVDISNQQDMTMNTTIQFTLQMGGAFYSNWALTYDNYVTFTEASNAISSVYNSNHGVWRTDVSDNTVIHEVGYFMKICDKYTESYATGSRVTTAWTSPVDWTGTIMGSNAANATKLDANAALRALGETVHLFE